MPTDPNLTAPIVLAGTALAGMGVLRLVTGALPAMPRAIAATVTVLGFLVAGFGLVLPQLADDEPPRPVATLEPVAPGPDGTPAMPEGAIDGMVRDPAGGPVRGASVSLRVFEGTEEEERIETTTADDGSFAFEELEMSPEIAYVVHVSYEDAVFGSELIAPSPHAPTQEVEIVVGPSTDDPSGIHWEVDTLVLVGDREGAQAVQVVSVTNSSELAYAGALRLPLLPDAAGLDPRGGLDPTRLWVLDGDLVSGAPVPPGTTQIVYTYGLPMLPEGVSFTRSVRYPTDRLEVLVDGLVLQVDGFHDDGRVTPPAPVAGEERSYRRYTAADPATGDTFSGSMLVDESRSILRLGIVALGIVVAAAIFTVPLLRRRRTGAPDREPDHAR